MKKTIKRILAVLLAVIMLATMGIPALAADTSSEEYKFFSLLDRSATGLSSAYSTGTSTGSWTAAKEQLLSYYTTKFTPLSWADYANNTGSVVPYMYDTLIFSDHEQYLSKQTVTTSMQQISIPLSAGQVNADYMLAVLQHNTASGVCMYSKEYGSAYAPKLSVNYSDGTSQDYAVSADTYIRATGKGQSNSYSTTSFGSSSNLWAMHRSDTSNNMPYSNDEMRTYIKFNYSANGKSISSAAIKVYAQVLNPNSGTPASGTTLELMAIKPCFTSWSESSMTWKTVADANSFAFYSWDGLGGIIWNETLYGQKYANLNVPNEFLNAASRFSEISTLCRNGYYTRAKEMLLRFADQTYDVIKNGTTTSGGFPTINRPIEPANRSLVFPYIYRTLLMNNALTAEENYKLLRWYYQDIQFIYKEKTGNIFLNGGATPNTSTNSYRDNFGAWHITAFYNTFAFFPEFSESSSWRSMFESRLGVMAGVMLNDDGSYPEVSFSYPSAVIGWYTYMLKYMGKMGYTSSSSALLKQTMINLVKYLVDCSYPSGYVPKYGDGGNTNIRSLVNSLLSIDGITDNESKQLKNLLYYQNSSQGVMPATSAYYPDSKIVTDRTGWTANDSMLFMNGKGGGIHSHADSLSVLMYTKGREMLADKGHLTYDSSNEGFDLNNRTYTHNTVEVDGTGQRHPGSSGATVRSGYDGTAENIKQYSNSGVNTIRAYTTSNANAKHYRNVTWVKDFDGLLLVNDWINSNNSSARSCTQNWHTMPDASPATTTSLGGFSGNWGYTSFSSGANMMISQAAPNGDGTNSITGAVRTGPDSNSSTGKSQYFEFAQSGKNVTYNTAIAAYNGSSMGIRTMKMDTGVKDYVASAMQVQRFNNSSLSSLVDEISYYNSFETSPTERTVKRRVDSNGQYFMFKTNASNALFHVRLNETVDSLSLSNGTKIDTYMASSNTSTEETPMARLNTSSKVTDLYAKYDVNTGVVSIETSDKDVIRGVTSVTVEFTQFSGITAVKLNGETLSTGVSISGNTAVVSAVPSNWDKEYYYPSGTHFVKNIALCYYANGSTAFNQIKAAAGGFEDEYSHLFPDSFHTYFDNTHEASVVYQDLAEGTGNGKYIYMGYNMTTNPAAANACKGVGLETTEFDNALFDDTITSSARGINATWYKCNTGSNSTYSPKLHSDGAVDLNKDAGGATIYLYSTYDRDFGPPIDCIAVVDNAKSEYSPGNGSYYGANSDFRGAGWYVCGALNSPSNIPNLNQQAGSSHSLYMYYHTPCVEVNSEALRSSYADLQEKYNNISAYSLTSPTTVSTIQSALSTAQTIINDLNDGYTTYTQAQITSAANECAAQSGRMTKTVTVTYNVNGGTSAAPSAQSFAFGSSVTTASAPVRAYTVSYDANGGSSTPSTQTASYSFSGWKSSVTGTIVSASSNVSSAALVGDDFVGNVTLTAQWSPASVTLADAVSKTGYAFAGWICSADNTVKQAGSSYTPAQNVSMQAKWAIMTYTVSFVNYDGSVLQSGAWDYGATPVYSGSTPQRTADAHYTYTFTGWSPAITSVTDRATYTAQYSTVVNKYTVIWKDYSGIILETDENVPYGTMPEFNGTEPSRAGSAQTTYTFAGWSPSVSAVTGNVTYTAQYTSTTNKYTVIWKNDDGTILETDENVPYGTLPSYDSTTPKKTADAQYTYVFTGWSPNVSAVTGDVTYTAQYNSRINKYTVTWLDSDGTTLKTDRLVPYGTTPDYGDTPVKDADEQYIYTFSHWSPEISEVSGDITYTAVYETQLQQYDVTFIDPNGFVLASMQVPYGETPVYSGEAPVKAYDSTNHYIFNGWIPQLAPVTENTVYMAKFEGINHNLTYVSDGAKHHGECSCGYVTASQPHTADAEGICTLCGVSTSMFYIDFGDVTITESGASGYDENGNPFTTGALAKYVVTQLNPGRKADHCINVVSGTNTVELQNINIERTALTAYAVSVQGTANATFIITGENHITSGTYRAGLDIAVEAAATLEGDGTLYAQSPLQAGIGGGNGRSNGTLIINSGDIYATGGIDGYSAGIGGGTSGKGGNIIINGGYVVAVGGSLASGIGGGNGFTGGNITINGGTVTATGGQGGAGIGGGYTANGGNIIINGGTVKAIAGTGADAIGNGYKCTTAFAGVHNQSGNEVTLHILDIGEADRVYFNGIDTGALRHHPDDNSYYFYTDSDSAVTAYTNDTVKFYIGADLTETAVYTVPCYRKGEYLLVKDTQNVTSSNEFTFTDGGLVYEGKVIDRATPGLLGDVNLDGNVDAEDSIMANCIVARLLTLDNFPEIQYLAADYNLDGEITEEDVTLLEEAGLLGIVSENTPETDLAEEVTLDAQEIPFFDRISAFFGKVFDLFR